MCVQPLHRGYSCSSAPYNMGAGRMRRCTTGIRHKQASNPAGGLFTTTRPTPSGISVVYVAVSIIKSRFDANQAWILAGSDRLEPRYTTNGLAGLHASPSPYNYWPDFGGVLCLKFPDASRRSVGIRTGYAGDATPKYTSRFVLVCWLSIHSITSAPNSRSDLSNLSRLPRWVCK